MKKNIIFAAICTALILGLTGCGLKEQKMQTYMFQPDTVAEIQVNADTAPVLLVKGTSDSIEVNFTQEVAVLENGVLKINTPKQKAGIHIKNPKNLIIQIPDTYTLPIQIISECGDVNVSDVAVSKLTITDEAGNITLSGLTGHIAAQADVGEIETGLSFAGEIEKLNPIGQTLDTNIGNSANEVSVHANAGYININ